MSRKKKVTKTKPFLSVIIPVFNERKRINNLIKITKFLSKQNFKSELIIVDDGSTDTTIKKIKKMTQQCRFQLISYSVNQGKGFAIKTGMLAASGRYRLFIDIDLSTPIEELNNLLRHVRRHDVVIGSRKLKSSNLIIRQSLLREQLGKVFTMLSQMILQLPLSDFTCGFKCFSEEAATDVFSRQTINRWGFDSEILFICKNRKFSIKEVPVTWSNDPVTKVKFPQDIYSSLIDLMRIRLNYLKGIYQ